MTFRSRSWTLKFCVKVLVKFFVCPYLRIKLILCMLVDIGLKFYAVPSWHSSDLEVKVMGNRLAKRKSGELCCRATALILGLFFNLLGKVGGLEPLGCLASQ